MQSSQSDLKFISILQAVEESLKSVNLYHGGVADKQARKYSGGMKRRLSVAISLIGDPKVNFNLYLVNCIILFSHSSRYLHLHLFEHLFRSFTWMSLVLDLIQLQETIYGML